jgi:hypothetical protein
MPELIAMTLLDLRIDTVNRRCQRPSQWENQT